MKHLKLNQGEIVIVPFSNEQINTIYSVPGGLPFVPKSVYKRYKKNILKRLSNNRLMVMKGIIEDKKIQERFKVYESGNGNGKQNVGIMNCKRVSLQHDWQGKVIGSIPICPHGQLIRVI